ATLRRGRFDEFTWAAISGFAASLPSTIHSIVVVRARPEFSLSLPEAVDFAVSLVFVVLLMVALFRNRGPSAMEYLVRHYGEDRDAEPTKPSWFAFWKKS